MKNGAKKFCPIQGSNARRNPAPGVTTIASGERAYPSATGPPILCADRFWYTSVFIFQHCLQGQWFSKRDIPKQINRFKTNVSLVYTHCLVKMLDNKKIIKTLNDVSGLFSTGRTWENVKNRSKMRAANIWPVSPVVTPRICNPAAPGSSPTVGTIFISLFFFFSVFAFRFCSLFFRLYFHLFVLR